MQTFDPTPLATTRFQSVERLSRRLSQRLEDAKPREPAPEPGSGRAITRRLGAMFASVEPPPHASHDRAARTTAAARRAVADAEAPACLVVVKGPGRGCSFALTQPLTAIGRGEGQDIQLDFGDESISRICQAMISHDAAEGTYRIWDGGKINPARLNGTSFRGIRGLRNGDLLTFGTTTLLFAISDG